MPPTPSSSPTLTPFEGLPLRGSPLSNVPNNASLGSSGGSDADFFALSASSASGGPGAVLISIAAISGLLGLALAACLVCLCARACKARRRRALAVLAVEASLKRGRAASNALHLLLATATSAPTSAAPAATLSDALIGTPSDAASSTATVAPPAANTTPPVAAPALPDSAAVAALFRDGFSTASGGGAEPGASKTGVTLGARGVWCCKSRTDAPRGADSSTSSTHLPASAEAARADAESLSDAIAEKLILDVSGIAAAMAAANTASSSAAASPSPHAIVGARSVVVLGDDDAAFAAGGRQGMSSTTLGGYDEVEARSKKRRGSGSKFEFSPTVIQRVARIVMGAAADATREGSGSDGLTFVDNVSRSALAALADLAQPSAALDAPEEAGCSEEGAGEAVAVASANAGGRRISGGSGVGRPLLHRASASSSGAVSRTASCLTEEGGATRRRATIEAISLARAQSASEMASFLAEASPAALMALIQSTLRAATQVVAERVLARVTDEDTATLQEASDIGVELEAEEGGEDDGEAEGPSEAGAGGSIGAPSTAPERETAAECTSSPPTSPASVKGASIASFTNSVAPPAVPVESAGSARPPKRSGSDAPPKQQQQQQKTKRNQMAAAAAPDPERLAALVHRRLQRQEGAASTSLLFTSMFGPIWPWPFCQCRAKTASPLAESAAAPKRRASGSDDHSPSKFYTRPVGIVAKNVKTALTTQKEKGVKGQGRSAPVLAAFLGARMRESAALAKREALRSHLLQQPEHCSPIARVGGSSQQQPPPLSASPSTSASASSSDNSNTLLTASTSNVLSRLLRSPGAMQEEDFSHVNAVAASRGTRSGGGAARNAAYRSASALATDVHELRSERRRLAVRTTPSSQSPGGAVSTPAVSFFPTQVRGGPSASLSRKSSSSFRVENPIWSQQQPQQHRGGLAK